MEHRYHEPVRRRLAQMSARLLALAHPEAVAPDRLLVSERTERIGWHPAQALTYREVELGEAFGPQWATYWFRIEATIPLQWAGETVELAWDSGSEATLWREGEPLQGLNAGAHGAAHRGAADRRGGRRRPRGGVRRDGLQLVDGRRRSRAAGALRRWCASTPPRGRRRGTSRRCASSRPSRTRARLGRSPARRAQPLLRRVGPRRARGGARDPRRPARPRQRRARAPDDGGRPRAPRHRVAVAARRVPPQGHPLVRQPAGPHGSLSRAPLRGLVGPALRVARGGRSRSLRARARARARGALGGRRRRLGGAGLQPALRRVARAPAALRAARVRGVVRAALPRVLEPRHLRPQRPAPADPPRRGDRPLPDPEALLEPVHEPAAPLVPLGGHRRLGGAGALPAGRHLQRAGHDRRAARRRRPLPRPRPVGVQPARLRPRRRRRRARCRRCSSWPAGRATSRASPASRSARATRSSRASRRSSRAARRWSASCTSSSTAARTRARRGPSAATARASGCCTRPRRPPRWPAACGERSTRPTSCARCGARCSSTSSTTSCPAARSARSTRTRSATTPPWRRVLRGCATPPSRRSARPAPSRRRSTSRRSRAAT